MRVLFLIDTMKIGGAQKVILSHSEYLLSQGHEVTIVSIKKSNHYVLNSKINFIEIVNYEEKILENIFFILNTLSLQTKNVDIIIGFSDLIVNYIAHILARTYNIPLLLSTRTHLRALFQENKKLLKINKDLCKSIYKRTPLVAPSNFIKNDLEKYLGIEGKNIIVLSNPIKKPYKKIVRKQTKKYISVIGRLSKVKNHAFILKAFAKIENKIDKKIYLCFVGEGEEKKSLQKLCKKLGISKRVLFKGYQKNVGLFLKKSFFTIVASKREGYPNIIIESFIHKTLVLASDIDPIKELVENKVNGILFKKDNLKDLSKKMILCLEKNLQHCTRNAYKKLDQYYEINERFEKILKTTIQGYNIENT